VRLAVVKLGVTAVSDEVRLVTLGDVDPADIENEETVTLVCKDADSELRRDKEADSGCDVEGDRSFDVVVDKDPDNRGDDSVSEVGESLPDAK
jgi:hypothetical protein